MISYTHRSVTASAIFITILIFSIINLSYDFFQNLISNQNLIQNIDPNNQENIVKETNNTINNVNKNVPNNTLNKTNNTDSKNTVNDTTNKTNSSITNKINTTTKSNTKTENLNKLSELKINDWRIVVPSIELNAQISEGTSSEVMDEFVGHFENTDIWNGNIALAGHNRGYPVNYFARIKELDYGDIIQYYYQGNLREYAVQTVTIISDTDWSYLGKTSDNRITLITCVEDEPEYRRCIQGVEI